MKPYICQACRTRLDETETRTHSCPRPSQNEAFKRARNIVPEQLDGVRFIEFATYNGEHKGTSTGHVIDLSDTYWRGKHRTDVVDSVARRLMCDDVLVAIE